MRDVTEMDMVSLQQYAKGLQEALIPFAHAGQRCRHYGDPEDGDELCALRGDNVFELLAFDADVVEGTMAEDCRQLNVQDLLVAGLALEGKLIS